MINYYLELLIHQELHEKIKDWEKVNEKEVEELILELLEKNFA